MKVYYKTDIGRKREMNQDFAFSSDVPVGCLPNLFLVADGMGGHKAGEYASRHTVECVIASVIRQKEGEPVSILRNAIHTANALLMQESLEEESKRGMGTTLVAAMIWNRKLLVANVGDSRLYTINDDISQITKDHSLVEQMVELGQIEKKEARNHPDKNVITKAIGIEENIDPDFFEVSLEGVSDILICTDGLTNMVEDSEILHIIQQKKTVRQKVEELIDRANENGGKDNITAMIIEQLTDEVEG